MLKDKTVFILGAGASMDYDFPSGHSLLMQIREMCMGIENREMRYITNSGFNSTQQFVELGRVINEVNFTSIDALLETYPEYADQGKFLIAAALLPVEHKDRPFNITQRPKNWMLYLLEKMQGRTFSQFKENQVTFITFNYDRSLDYFLRRHLKGRYRESDQNIEEVLSQMPVIHVHGQLGSLKEVPYGEFDLNRGMAPASVAAKGIRIIYEADKESLDFLNAHAAIANARRVGILGFGFHPDNMERMKFKTLLKEKLLYATCFGMTEPELSDVRSRVTGGDPRFNPCNCLDLLKSTSLLF